MTQAHPCLLSISKTSSNYKHFPFLEDQVKIGRAVGMTYTILSPTISRCHAIIEKKGDNTWTITDNKSLNSTAVNGTWLKPLEPHILQDGDTVQLGVSMNTALPAEFMYRFFSSLKVRREPSSAKQKQKRPPGEQLKHMLTVPDQNAGVSRKRKVAESGEDPEDHKRLKTAYEGKLQALTRQLKEKEVEKSAIAKQLQQERQERQAVEARQKEQEKKVSQLDAKQRQLLKEKAAAEAEMREQLEKELQEREERLRHQMQQKLMTLTTEKKQVEKRLKTEMEKAVREKNQELQDRLQEEKERLQKVIETKELEQKALESQLAESRVENEKAKADTLIAREAILSEFADTMETELQCTICSELFVKATSLNCSHAFCALCLRQWLAVKNECPNCRAQVTSQMRSIVLDSYIDRMVEQLSEERKRHRAQLVAERKEEEAKLDEAENQEKAGPSRTTARGRRRGRGRAGRGRGGRAATRRAAATAGPPEVVATVTHDSSNLSSADEAGAGSAQSSITESTVITESEEEESQNVAHRSSEDWESSQEAPPTPRIRDIDSSDTEEDFLEMYGLDRGYYGGYGRCSSCGRCHWTYQCPE